MWDESIVHLQKLIRNGAKSKKDKALFDNIRNLYYQYSLACKDSKDANVNDIYEILLQPLFMTYARVTYDIEGFERIYELAETNNRLIDVYSEWKKLSKIEAETFAGIAVSMAKSYQELKEAVDYFKENTKAKK